VDRGVLGVVPGAQDPYDFDLIKKGEGFSSSCGREAGLGGALAEGHAYTYFNSIN
jgi:hypothetical protein